MLRLLEGRGHSLFVTSTTGAAELDRFARRHHFPRKVRPLVGRLALLELPTTAHRGRDFSGIPPMTWGELGQVAIALTARARQVRSPATPPAREKWDQLARLGCSPARPCTFRCDQCWKEVV